MVRIDQFLDLDDFNETPQQSHTSFTIELQKEEFKTLWEKVRLSYEEFVTSNNTTDSEEDCDAAGQLFKECRLAYISCAAQMGELSQSFITRPILSSTHNVSNAAGASNFVDNRMTSHHIKLPPCTTEIFRGDYQSWPSFRDMFTAVYINGNCLTSVEKLFYLRQNTRDEALEHYLYYKH